MKSYFLFLSLLAVSIQNPNRKLPFVEIKSLDGKVINASDISNNGKPMVISIWETTCKPCIHEFDAIAESYSDWQKETGVKLVAISIDDTRTSSNVPTLVNTKDWEYEVYLDLNQDFKRAMNISYCPYTFLMDGEGNIVWEKGSYAEGDEIKLYELVKKLARGETIK